ncbi:MAG: hypothetical protein RBR06_06760 [Desulfuromonadaceae bacterium]|nr:hypothetical protein [Desulfuromonadaceae bacterium]
MNNVDFSLKVLSQLEPAELIYARVAALQCAEYSFIYASYHPDSNFRRNFTSCQDYLGYVRAELSATPQVGKCTVIKKELVGGKIAAEHIEQNVARVLHSMEITLQDGSDASYYEVAELSKVKGGWRYLRGYKVPITELEGISEEHLSFEIIVKRGVCF